jgi:hypothetical protein
VKDRANSLHHLLKTEILSGARPALPMGVAPEAILENVSSIGSSNLLFFPYNLHITTCFAQ